MSPRLVVDVMNATYKPLPVFCEQVQEEVQGLLVLLLWYFLLLDDAASFEGQEKKKR